ncbi:HAD family hydrolase [Dyella sp.]|uniref:HAD family hydrolase n=1 Tax=Dyella sp. TaxID=1869338 RepID=UPI002ED5A378
MPLKPHHDVAPGYAALLFDMDGTLLNSIPAAERIWSRWARRHGLDPQALLPTIHGKRAVDTVAQLGLPGIDPQAEAAGITQDEIEDVEGVVAIPGALDFLQSLPPDRWAIVTSAPIALARRRMEAAGIPMPAVLVTAEDVQRGKPDPTCYHVAASRLGVNAADCLIFEDAPAGIEAGERAGRAVVVITATHEHPMATSHACIASYEEIIVDHDAQGMRVVARNPQGSHGTL